MKYISQFDLPIVWLKVCFPRRRWRLCCYRAAAFSTKMAHPDYRAKCITSPQAALRTHTHTPTRTHTHTASHEQEWKFCLTESYFLKLYAVQLNDAEPDAFMHVCGEEFPISPGLDLKEGCSRSFSAMSVVCFVMAVVTDKLLLKEVLLWNSR